MSSNTEFRKSSLWLRFSAVRTGILLVILVGIASALGTLILQRPLVAPEDLERVYSPQTLSLLDKLGLTDVFHSWWFRGLIAILGVNIALASLDRFPLVWRFFRRPYRRPDAHFVASLPIQQEVPIRSPESGLCAAERSLRRMSYKPQHVERDGELSLYAEQNRFARVAPYVVHASLLLIFAGAVADAIWGYHGYVALRRGDQVAQIELRDGAKKDLPFTLRCDGAGQENYPDGSPRRWWSKLAVLENGREVEKKEIEVNDPLVFRGLRFFQSGFGSTDDLQALRLRARLKVGRTEPIDIVVHPGEPVQLDSETSVRLGSFVPDFVLNGQRSETRSNQPNNPAIQLLVESKRSGLAKVWLFPRFPEFSHPGQSSYAFELRDVEMAHFTGLQVSYEPGQWAVWAGCLLMALGLTMAFYFVHIRIWAVPVRDARGRLMLWVGGSANKNRREFEERFRKLVDEIEQSLSEPSEARAEAHPAFLANT